MGQDGSVGKEQFITAHRYEELKRGAVPLPSEEREYRETLAWERRSQAAFRAVRTKRKRYKAWPSRSRKHLE